MKIVFGIFATIAFLLPLSGPCAYPTMQRAKGLFDEMSVCADYVSMRTELYRKFAEDLRCQTAPESAREMETFLLEAITTIGITVSTNSVDQGTNAGWLVDRGDWFSAAARNFHDLPTNPTNCMGVAAYLGSVHRVDFPSNLLCKGSRLVKRISIDPRENSELREKARARRSEYELQARVKATNEAVDEYRRDLLSICNVGVRGCRRIMDDAQFCAFTNQLATVSGASEAERRVLFDSIPSQDEGE